MKKTWWRNKSKANTIHRSHDSNIGSSLFHAAWDSVVQRGTFFSQNTHQSSPPTVVKSDNPVITAILNELFRSEVSQATVCTASPSALTRLCRFMQMRSNPRNTGDSGVFKSVSWPFSVPLHSGWQRSQRVNERGSLNSQDWKRERKKERQMEEWGVMKF